VRSDARHAPAILAHLATGPDTSANIARALGLPYAVALDKVKQQHATGRLERLARGVYGLTERGRAELQPTTARPARKLQAKHAPVPEGRGVKGERLKWLEAHYELLGAATCARLLNVTPGCVYTRARKIGLRWGDVPDRILLTDLTTLTGISYTNAYRLAREAGVLKTAGVTRHRRTKASVPVAWADSIAAKYGTTIEHSDVALREIEREHGIPYSNLERWSRGHRKLGRRAGEDFFRLYVSEPQARALIERSRTRTPRPSHVTALLTAMRDLPVPAPAAFISERAGVDPLIGSATLYQLSQRGRVLRPDRGYYQLPLQEAAD
jgi:hypothetical protein